MNFATWYCTTLAEADSVQNAQCANSDSLYKNSKSCFFSEDAANAYVDSIKNSYDIASDMSFTSSISSYGVPACGTTYYCAYVYLDFCGSEFEKANTQKKKSECCKANYAPGNNSCVSPMALGGTGGFSISGYLSSNFCSETYGSAATSKFCQDSVSGESSSSGSASSSSAESGSSSSTDGGSSSSMGTESSSSEGEESSSSMEIENSSSEFISSSSMQTSSSSSENWECSSSVETGSSSSADVMSSWYEESSSSVGSGSDVGERSSSSSGDLCPQHPFASVPANPLSACFSHGGKCYKCNPDRGSDCGNDWLWIYDFNSSNVGWWYEEVDCSTGVAAASSSSGVGECPSHPLRYVPSDPLNTCFSYGGSCYKCNPDRGGDCGNDWLWIYSFNSGNVGWWYTEVDCYDPFEEEGQCPEDATLYKKTTAQAAESSSQNDSAYILETSKVFYDVLGRKTAAFPKTKRPLFQRKIEYQTTMDINSWNEDVSIYLKGSTIECGNNSRGEWICEEVSGESTLKKSGDDNCGILGVDYGIVEIDGSLTGGITCPGTSYKLLDPVISDMSEIGQCSDGSRLLKVSFTLTSTPSTLSRNEPFYVAAGYEFSNGYIATEEDEKAMKYHELGHVKYNECIEFPAVTESYSFDCFCESDLSEIKKTFEKTVNDRDSILLDEAKESFHQKYGTTGYAETYTCPEN